MTESKLQSTIIQYLKRKGWYVIKTRPGVGIPIGCPDIIALCGGVWIAIEVKGSPEAKYRPLQKETLDSLNKWSWARRVDPTNWPEVKAELDEIT